MKLIEKILCAAILLAFAGGMLFFAAKGIMNTTTEEWQYFGVSVLILAAIVGIGIWADRREKKKRQLEQDMSELARYRTTEARRQEEYKREQEAYRREIEAKLTEERKVEEEAKAYGAAKFKFVMERPDLRKAVGQVRKMRADAATDRDEAMRREKLKQQRQPGESREEYQERMYRDYKMFVS